MITLKSEVAGALAKAARSLEHIGRRLPDRARSACEECSAILTECAAEYAPKKAESDDAPARNPSDWQEAPEQVPAPKQTPSRQYPDGARRSAERLAERMKQTGVTPTGIASE